MKRIAMLLVVLLASVCFSAADTLTLNDGEGEMTGFSSTQFYTFSFRGLHASITVPFPIGDWPDAPGLQECFPCDPRQDFGPGSTIFFDSGEVGLMEFDAVSFVSSLASNGALTLIYTATARITFTTNLDGSLCGAADCFGPNLVWNPNIRWLVTAQFAPASFDPGTWIFVDAKFAPAVTPEPSSMLLMGSGIVIVIRKIRHNASPYQSFSRASGAFNGNA